MVGKACTARRADGRACRATPLRDEAFCFWHSPERTEEVADARRLGGLRRRREKTLAGAFDLTSLGTLEGIRRILEIAVFDALSLENSIARIRVLIAAVQAAAHLLETNDLNERVAALEAALMGRRLDPQTS